MSQGGEYDFILIYVWDIDGWEFREIISVLNEVINHIVGSKCNEIKIKQINAKGFMAEPG